MSAKARIRAFYNHAKDTYDVTYDRRGPVYPANLFRMKLAIRLLAQVKARDVLDVGCGTGLVSAAMIKKGVRVWGVDFAEHALAIARERVARLGYPVDRFRLGDVERLPYRPGSFDAVVALGVFPHLDDERVALRQIRRVLKPGGHLVVEFRNDLFDLFTFNSYTLEFIRDRLWRGSLLPPAVVGRALRVLGHVLRASASRHNGRGNGPRIHREESKFSALRAKWANPLTIDALFRATGFVVSSTSYYHYHALPPALERLAPGAFRRASMRLERNPNDWRGTFMASAFLVCARKSRAR